VLIFSETMVPGDLIERAGSLLAPMARAKKCWVLAGGVVHLTGKSKTGARSFNSAVLVSPRGKLVGRYDKRHLVPFGEYVPLGGRLPGSDIAFSFITIFTPGEPNQALPEVSGLPVAMSICYEDVFPHMVRSDAARGARLLVNLTNDSWFRQSDEARQHLALAALRAVETRRPLIRATNSGVSALVTPDGAVTVPENGGLWQKGLVRMDLRIGEPGRAAYVLVGDVFAYACAAAVLLGLLAATLPRRKRAPRSAPAPATATAPVPPSGPAPALPEPVTATAPASATEATATEATATEPATRVMHVPALSPDYRGPTALPPIGAAAEGPADSSGGSPTEAITKVVEPPPLEEPAEAAEAVPPQPEPETAVDFDALFEKILSDFGNKTSALDSGPDSEPGSESESESEKNEDEGGSPEGGAS
jgi:predicted amidohydrolase